MEDQGNPGTDNKDRHDAMPIPHLVTHRVSCPSVELDQVGMIADALENSGFRDHSAFAHANDGNGGVVPSPSVDGLV